MLANGQEFGAQLKVPRARPVAGQPCRRLSLAIRSQSDCTAETRSTRVERLQKVATAFEPDVLQIAKASKLLTTSHLWQICIRMMRGDQHGCNRVIRKRGRPLIWTMSLKSFLPSVSWMFGGAYANWGMSKWICLMKMQYACIALN